MGSNIMYTIYSKDSCGSCIQAKQLLEMKEQEFTYKVLNTDYTLSEFMKIAPKTHKTFPLIFKDDVYLGGLKELKLEF